MGVSPNLLIIPPKEWGAGGLKELFSGEELSGKGNGLSWPRLQFG